MATVNKGIARICFRRNAYFAYNHLYIFSIFPPPRLEEIAPCFCIFVHNEPRGCNYQVINWIILMSSHF
jgi:hypothetical protein